MLLQLYGVRRELSNKEGGEGDTQQKTPHQAGERRRGIWCKKGRGWGAGLVRMILKKTNRQEKHYLAVEGRKLGRVESEGSVERVWRGEGGERRRL